MTQEQLQTWIDDFEKEVQTIQIELDAFFSEKKIQDYYTIRLDSQNGSLSLDILYREDLPTEIIDRLTIAYLNTKPK